MTKGVIVQLDYDTAHILKNDGAFISCPRDMRWQIGDVVTIPHRPRISLKVILIACGVFLGLFAGTGITLYNIPTTYIEMSVNPSVQLTLNRFDRVLSVKGLNADGDKLLEGVSYNNLSLDEAYARLLNRLENNGYLTDAALQLIIANNSQIKIDGIEQNLRSIFEKYGQMNNLQVSIKRYANDEYLALEHPLPVRTIPALQDSDQSGQQTEPPSSVESSPTPSSEPISPTPSEPPLSPPEETSPMPSETTPSQPDNTTSPPPSSNPTAPPTNTPNNGNWHNGNWNNGDWRNGWWDWDCGW